MEYLQEQATAANVKISGFKSCSAHPQIAEQGLEEKEQQRDDSTGTEGKYQQKKGKRVRKEGR